MEIMAPTIFGSPTGHDMVLACIDDVNIHRVSIRLSIILCLSLFYRWLDRERYQDKTWRRVLYVVVGSSARSITSD